MSVHSWQMCVKKMHFKRNFLYTPNAENLYKGPAWNLSKRVKVFSLCVFFSNNFRFTSYKYVTFEYPKLQRPTYLIWFLLMISRQTDHTFEYGMVS